MFKKTFFTFLLFFLLIYLILPILSAENYSNANQERLENEYKIDLPQKSVEEVYNYLVERYKNPSWLAPGLTSSLLEEQFVDTYYDTPKLEVYDKWGGIRHRKRYDSKGKELTKQLIQIKVTSNKTDLTREEQKFSVNNQFSKKDLRDGQLSSHPFFMFVQAVDRDDAYNQISKMVKSPLELKPIVDIVQQRRRIYLENDKGVLITLTVDKTSGRIGLFGSTYYELELELNEIQYTQSSDSERKKLSKMSKQIYEDLKIEFPEIKKDQEPKYEKTIDKINKKFPLTKFLIRHALI